MADISLLGSAKGGWIGAVMGSLFMRPGARPSANKNKPSQAERDFVMEMLDRHPQAFSSPSDLPTLTCRYRGRF